MAPQVGAPYGFLLNWRSVIRGSIAARAVSLLLYLALGALAVAGIFGLATDVRAPAHRPFPPRRR